MRFEYYLNKVIEFFFSIIAYVTFYGGIFGGVVLLLAQIVGFLQEGEWTSYSLLTGLELFGGGLASWTQEPDTWIGLHVIFGYIPLSLFIVIFGMIAGGLLVFKYENFKDENEKLFKS